MTTTPRALASGRHERTKIGGHSRARHIGEQLLEREVKDVGSRIEPTRLDEPRAERTHDSAHRTEHARALEPQVRRRRESLARKRP